jgi:sirohydrochlorin ferrochelatase
MASRRRPAPAPYRGLTPDLEATLPSPQSISAVLIVAHGDGGEARLNGNVQHLSQQLAKRLDLPVDWGILKEPETFDAAHRRLGHAANGHVLVFPFFMSDGYFVRVKMPKILTDHGFADVERLTPFGMLDPLVDLIEHRLRSLASLSGGLVPSDLPTLLVAHGSRSGEPASRQRAEAVAATLTARGLGTIHLAFIEEPPSVADQLEAIDPRVVIGFFASEGTHALDDVKDLVDLRPGVLHHVAAIGTDESVAEMVAGLVEARIKG